MSRRGLDQATAKRLVPAPKQPPITDLDGPMFLRELDVRVEIFKRAGLDRWRFHVMAFVSSVDCGQ
jgi:hypothetical protein